VQRRQILLDACVAINLAATDSLDRIANSLHLTILIAQQAAAETGHLRDVINGELVLTPVDLSQFALGDDLQVLELAPSEFALYLELAAIVDDGEAATIAMAIERSLEIATDDRKARRLCEEQHLAEPVRTLALLHSYAEAAGLSDGQVRELLTKVRDRASFQPPRADPDLKWWNDHVGSA
jgi:predicted nucleic acid-binding protein